MRTVSEHILEEPGIEAEILPINPRLPRPLRWLQRIKYVRTLVTSIAYVASLLVRLPRFDGWRSTYWKLRRRGAFDFPVLSVAAAVKWNRRDFPPIR